jgi:hypothetical protein
MVANSISTYCNYRQVVSNLTCSLEAEPTFDVLYFVTIMRQKCSVMCVGVTVTNISLCERWTKLFALLLR